MLAGRIDHGDLLVHCMNYLRLTRNYSIRLKWKTEGGTIGPAASIVGIIAERLKILGRIITLDGKDDIFIEIGIAPQYQCISEVSMVIRDITAIEGDDSIPGILELYPGIRVGAPDLGSSIIDVTPGKEPGKDQDGNGDEGAGLHYIPTEVISVTQPLTSPAPC